MRWPGVTFLILLVLASHARSQEKKAFLLDAFDRVSCSDLRWRLDNLMTEVAKDNDFQGFVVFSGELDFLTSVVKRAPMEGQFNDRNFDLSRLHFVRRKGIPTLQTEFWLAAKAAHLPFEVQPEWDYKVPKNGKPFVAYTSNWHDSECHFPSGTKIFSRFLQANAGSRGNIVIRCKPKGCFSETKKLIQKELFQIDRQLASRVRYIYTPIRTQYYSTEFWLLP